MASQLQKKKAAQDLAMYFAEKGYIVAGREYNQDPDRPAHLKISKVKKLFRNWSAMLTAVKSFEPELMEGLTDTKPEPKPVEQPAVKSAKPAKEAEDQGDDAEDI